MGEFKKIPIGKAQEPPGCVASQAVASPIISMPRKPQGS